MMRRTPSPRAGFPDTGNSHWRTRARCREVDPELFFPTGNNGAAEYQEQEAKSVCRRCPVMESCLQWALETGQDTGVWGGTSEDERRNMRRHAVRKQVAA